MFAQETTSPTRPSAPREARRFLVDAAKLLHRCGTPAHRIEATLVACAAGLGLRLQVFASPTSIEMAFGGHRQRPYMIRSDAGDAQLARLVELDAILARVGAGELAPRAGRRAMRRIVTAPLPFGPAVTTAAFALASTGAARMFSGDLIELCISLGLGIILGLLALLAGKHAGIGRLFAPLTTFVTSSLSLVAAHMLPGVDASLTTLASLIVLVPGLSLTLAMTELATGHLVSGTARLAGSLTVFATMAVGVALAHALVATLPAFPLLELPALWHAPLPGWTRTLALVTAPIGFCVLFQARLADLPAIAISGIAAAETARLVNLFGADNPVLGAFAGAFVIGLAANSYAAWRRLPAAVVLLPGLLLLVPGSLGFQSLNSFLANDPLAGVEVGFRMVLLAVSLVAGVLVANTLSLPFLRQPACEHRAA